MTQTIRLCFVSLLCGLALWACSDPDVGTECSSGDECADDQECVPIVFGCADPDDCASTCEVTCTVDDDCGGGETCANRNGHLICRSTEIDDPSE